MRRWLALVATAALLTGCGSSDDEPGARASTATSGSPSPSASASTTEAGEAGELVLLDADGFTVRLPEKAQESQQKATSEVGEIPFTLYAAQDGDGGTFVVALTAYPKNAVLDLDGAVAGAAKAIDGKVVANQTIRFLDHPARAARITASAAGQDVTVFARTVLVGRRLFQLQYIVQEANRAAPPPIFAQVLGTVTFD